MGPIGCTETSNVPQQQQQLLRMVNKYVFDLVQLLCAVLKTIEFHSSLFTAINISLSFRHKGLHAPTQAACQIHGAT